ncbi:MAG: protein-methionine-sulfoxide reductase catalytic subunit MsrP [Pseudomonadota bacterium]|uniref:protein-methionine-sulfoxide reductase catalytic subunit MsrP n=1 Tax=Fodinicurvata fenggangensis TaxID=1121830 RepID=UPI0004790C41|nr:protein-methionine-sulfoxide reductase catalytic subunit MsrP [Fodinicurvata fenggangensis]
MLIRKRRGWELAESQATPEEVFRNRRRFMRAAGAGSLLLAGGGLLSACDDMNGGSQANAAESDAFDQLSEDPSFDLYPVERNSRYQVERDITERELAGTYNNFYEFGSSKNIWQKAEALPIRPWTLRIEGEVEEPFDIDIDDLLARMPLEERIYRLRCVEAWSMVIPWSGFQLSHMLDLARPTSNARYIRFTTLEDPEVMPGQRAGWYPWPYIEGLTMEEAANELAFMGTGMYGAPLPKQNGAPLRLVVPWKYGFKSIKSVVSIAFTRERPVSFWEEIAGNEYGFWANVNPEVAHPRWSQAEERVVGNDERVPTRIYNGYGEYVSELYAGMDQDDRLYR